MKYVIFALALVVGAPVGYLLARRFAWAERVLFFALVFFTCDAQHINFVSREWMRLTSRGFEITLVDILALAVLGLVLDRRGRKPGPTRPPGLPLYLVYLVFSLLSIVNAAAPLYSFMEIWKMLRMIGFLWIVYNYLDEPGRLDQLMGNIAGVIIYIFATLMRDRYVYHIFQTKGPFPHQNSLVMYMCIFASLVLAYMLNRRDIAFPFWFAVFGMGGICIVFTLSRAGMAVFALSVAVIIAMSLGREFNPRTLAVILLLFAAGAAVLIKASGTIKERIETAPEESAQVRVLLARAAAKMANDKILGIGLNNFGIKINPPYTYGDEIEHKASEGDVQNGLVETIYLMIAAETGWFNLGVFLLWIFFLYAVNLRNLKYYRNSPYRFVCIGLTGGLTAIYLESALEWVLKQTNNAYQLMLVFAVIGAMRRWAKYPEGDAVENPSAPAVA